MIEKGSICLLCRQLVKACEQIDSLANSLDTDESSSLSDVFGDMLVDELEHVQVLTLKLTDLISPSSSDEEANTDESDGSAFFAGELSDVKKPDKEDSKEIAEAYVCDDGPPKSVGVFVVSDGKLLTGTRLAGDGIGELSGPGGFCIFTEDPEDAAIRETAEEFGIVPVELVQFRAGDSQTPALYLCTDFDGEPVCNSGEIVNPKFRSIDAMLGNPDMLFQPFHDGLVALMSWLNMDNKDGGDGSGNWGHEGRPGKLGGSDKGGGSHNRLGSKEEGYTSFSKEKKKMAKPHKSDFSELSKCPNDTIVSSKKGTFRKKEYKYEDPDYGTQVETGFVNLETGETVSAMQLYMSLNESEMDCSLAIPDSANKNFKKLRPENAGAFAKSRKQSAFQTEDPQTADNEFREQSGNIWRELDDEVKSALYNYTGSGYRGINGSLRSGKINEKRANRINDITEAISKSKMEQDTWLYRGTSARSIEKMLGLDEGSLYSTNLDSLIGRVCRDEGFMSCGTAKGKGFTEKEVQLSVYCPSGTEGLYVEPFSALGSGHGMNWDEMNEDGRAAQVGFSDEQETILQRGSEFQIVSAKESDGRIYMDVQITGQHHSGKVEANE